MTIKKDLQKVYDNIADEFSASRVFPWEELQVFIPYIKNGFKILDLGCGNGRLLKILDESGKEYEYFGLDFSEKMIGQARNEHPDKYFMLADMTEAEFEPESMDMVFMVAVFHHLPSRTDRLEMLKKIKTWLKPGGYLIMTNWRLWQRKYLKDYWRKFWLKRSYNDFYIPWQRYSSDEKKYLRYYHSFTERELSGLLKKTGFDFSPKGVYKTKWNINCLVKK